MSVHLEDPCAVPNVTALSTVATILNTLASMLGVYTRKRAVTLVMHVA